MILRFKSTPAQHKRYRDLLQGSWSIDAMRQVVELVDEQLHAAGFHISFQPDDDDGHDDAKLYTIPPGASETLREHLEQLNYTLRLDHQKRKEERLKRAPDIAQEIEVLRTALLLTFPLWTQAVLQKDVRTKNIKLEGTNFFDDCRSLLFLTSVHELLPILAAHPKWAKSERLLRHALYAHASVMWTDKPAHQHFLLAEFFEAIGDSERASAALQHAFLNTPSEDHDYFTTAFAYWSHLMEHGDMERARDFALKLNREAPQQWLEKSRELVEEFYTATAHDP